MKVILREDVPDLGIIGEVVNVKPGYARNFLLPRRLAVLADERNLNRLEHEKRVIAAKRLKERSSVEAMADALTGQMVETEERAGRGGKLFGSVTNIDVARMLTEKGFEIDRRRVVLKEPIKAIGEYEVTVRVGQDVTARVKVSVRPLGGELVDEAVDGEPEEASVTAAEVFAEGESEDGGDAKKRGGEVDPEPELSGDEDDEG